MMIRTITALVTLIAATSPSTEPANFSKSADDTYSVAISNAQQTYNAETEGSRRRYLRDLQRALTVALAAKDLKEANRIDLESKALQKEVEPATEPSHSFSDTQPSRSAVKSMTGSEADANFTRSINVAKDVYDRKIESARQSYLTNLHTALNAAFNSRALDQANEIDSKIKSFSEPTGSSPSRLLSSQNQTTAALPPGVTAREIEQFAPQLRLAASLAGTTWQGIYDKDVMFTGDGNGRSLTGRKFRWNAISDDQVLLIWTSLDADLLTFDGDRKTVQKRWIGSSLKDSKVISGKRVQSGDDTK